MSLKARITRTNASLWSPLALRLAVGAIMFIHGAQKLFGWFGGPGFDNTVQAFAGMGLNPAKLMAALAGGGEFLGGILLVLGLFTRLAALNTVVIMAVAVFISRSGGFSGVEFPLAVLVASLALLELGGGALSCDSKVGSGVSTIKP